MFENNLIAGAAGQAAGFYPYSINQSLRFNDDDSAYLSRTPATAGNRKTWTWSGWVKRGNLGSNQGIFTARDNSANDFFYIAFSSGDSISINDVDSSSDITLLNTEAVFRDPSSWYHIVVVIDTTQASSTERIKLWVNGQRFTSFTGNILPPLNFDGLVNSSSVLHRIGHFQDTSRYLDGYMAEINFIDGQALDPTSFGEFKSGVWVAKRYTGTYGTNGFYLPFENGLGNDESGNGNDWTANNLAATDIVLDSPTNNFGTMNSVAKASSITLSEGNLEIREPGANDVGVYGTHAMQSGKYYFEYKYVGGSPYQRVGIEAVSDYSTSNYNTGVFINPGGAYDDNSSVLSLNGSPAATSFSSSSIVMMAVDVDAGKAWFGLDGTWLNSGDPAAGTNWIIDIPAGESVVAAVKIVANTSYIVANFGQEGSFAGNETAQGNTDENGIGDFYYTPPAGFLALCTANLPEPEISPADDESPSDYFNTVLYTGNGGTQSITGVGFQPDYTWIKRRSDAANHMNQDAVRGSTKHLHSNTADAEVTDNTGVTSFDTDGFSLGSNGNVNDNAATYVAWNWKAGGSGVTNTDGSITSTVSASPESGFSIVSFTGTGSIETVGHGLDVAPEMVIAKRRDSTGNWAVQHRSAGSGYLLLNSTIAYAGADPSIWNATFPTDSVFTAAGGFFVNAGTYIAYCFHSVEGFSKFGSYTGNGSSDGPFVYTGFRPAFVLIKRSSTSGNWYLYDNRRDDDNAVGLQLFPNLSNAELSETIMDFTSNGFKLRTTASEHNQSGQTYIYACFAENPFKYSLAR